ncbi:mitochondrial kynurenine/alpha-aminoadipate aminotransferase [Martensiomyces pterosporus]|nr:mitochondrial kynurenine/alpha-aminoadipate aminotransferase [Martensiomyces pterosporus]
MPVKSHSKDLSQFFTEATRLRKNSPLKSLLKYMAADPTLVSLGAGLPHPDTFPIASFGANVAEAGTSAVANDAELIDASITTAKSGIEGLDKFLQYGNGRGVPSYAQFAREHTEHVHSPAYEDWDVIVSAGNTDAFVKSLMLFCQHGDTLIVDEWTYPAIMETVAPMGVQLAPVGMDSQGIIPEALDRLCSSWSGPTRAPRVAYLIPTAQNPTGATMSIERKREVYAVAQKHNIVIIEDDPYYYLQFSSYKPLEEVHSPEERYSELPGLASLIPSFLSIDVDGRVIRLDSFSKVLAPGLRCGWITAPRYITDKIQFHNETSIQQPSGVSQGIVSKLMNEKWGHAGWERHLVQIQRDYAVRRDHFVDLCNRHLKGMVEFTVPDAGMFLWFHVLLSEEAKRKKGVMQEIFDAMIANHVLLVPGHMFSPLGASAEVLDKPYMRAAFSYASTDNFETAICRLAEALKPFTN